MSDKHTQGPWEFEEEPDQFIYGVKETKTHGKNKEIIARVSFLTSKRQGRDNARLIAAAPELLEALEATANMYQNATGLPMPSQAYRAIAKAKGGSDDH